MAIITRESLGNLHDKLNVKLSKEEYLPSFDKRLKEFAKTANVPGFRKGMVPAALIRKMSGQAIFTEEVMKRVSKELENYIKGEKLIVFGQPLLHNPANLRLDVNSPNEVSVDFEIGIKPDFNIAAVDNKATFTEYKIAVTDKLVEDELERICRRYGREEERDAVTYKEDIIHFTLQPSDADGNVTAGSEEKELAEELSKFPVKLQEMLMGKIAGAVEVFRPADVCTAEELPDFMHSMAKAHKSEADHYFIMKLIKACELFPAELGFELYEKIFPGTVIKDNEEFKGLLRAELEKEFARLAKERLQSEIYENLVHTTEISLPVTFLKRLMKENNEKEVSDEEVNEGFSAFEHQLRWQLITEKLMGMFKVHVAREEVYQSIKANMSAYFGFDIEEESENPFVKSQLDKMMQNEKLVDETFSRILTSKIFYVLEQNLNIEHAETEESVFFKMPHPHSQYHHHHEHEHAHA